MPLSPICVIIRAYQEQKESTMNNHLIYGMIPYQLLGRIGFPTTYTQLSLDQKFFIDNVFGNNDKVAAENLNLVDKVYQLEDKVADLEHELKNLTGKK